MNNNEAKDEYKQMLLYMTDSCLVAIKGSETSIVAQKMEKLVLFFPKNFLQGLFIQTCQI